jgi:hypothetical protein
MPPEVSHTQKTKTKKARKVDALALAQLIYDVYKEQQNTVKIEPGKHNAK